MNNIIELKNVCFDYKINGLETLTAVNNVSMAIPIGSHIAILGRNGSGKSTLARLINGLEVPSKGLVTVDNITLTNEQNAWEIRKRCGMVFQNPDNQIIGTTVEEDVAFGPENLGMPREQMIIEIDKALAIVGLLDKKKIAPHLLSGGQKQKLAIAGILAMNPKCCILDEATSMLDPLSRKDLMKLVTMLVKEKSMTVINITHHMEEAILADYVYVMDKGSVIKEGHPRDVFDEISVLKNAGLDVPVHIDIAQTISEILNVSRTPLKAFTIQGAIDEIIRMCETVYTKNIKIHETKNSTGNNIDNTETNTVNNTVNNTENNIENIIENNINKKVVIQVNGLSHTYNKDTIFASDAIADISFNIIEGELFGIVGKAGSGKSTLVQHFNGLIRAQTGSVVVFDLDTSSKSNIKAIRKRAGLLFQYPEHQLFEETVYQDIEFGPKCLGFNNDEIRQSVDWAIKTVGLDASILDKSPFELSGGQKRRVAIAGIIAMKPDILILDEPAAGLDPVGREEILNFMKKLCSDGTTVVLVSHNMDDIARLSDRILVLKDAKQMICDTPKVIFSSKEEVARLGLSLPVISEFMIMMSKKLPNLSLSIYNVYDCSKEIIRAFYSLRNGEGANI